MATTIVYLATEQARAAAAAEAQPTKSVHFTELATGLFGHGASRRAISALEAAGGHFYWRHVIDGLLRTSYFGVTIDGPTGLVDAVLSKFALGNA